MKDTFPLDFLADVNDGVKVLVTDKKNKAICKLDFWQDVQPYDNYHSTDANGIEHVCNSELKEGELYNITIDFYHEPDTSASNELFNRADLDLSFQGLRAKSARVEFSH